MKYKIEKNTVQETLILPLYSRKLCTELYPNLYRDETAVRLIDENVACVREWVANIFFYRKGDTTIMVDAGYNYDRLAEKMNWLGIDPHSIRHILITHQDTDHVGAVCRNCRLSESERTRYEIQN